MSAWLSGSVRRPNKQASGQTETDGSPDCNIIIVVVTVYQEVRCPR
jgi:hypothetical protein